MSSANANRQTRSQKRKVTDALVVGMGSIDWLQVPRSLMRGIEAVPGGPRYISIRDTHLGCPFFTLPSPKEQHILQPVQFVTSRRVLTGGRCDWLSALCSGSLQTKALRKAQRELQGQQKMPSQDLASSSLADAVLVSILCINMVHHVHSTRHSLQGFYLLIRST